MRFLYSVYFPKCIVLLAQYTKILKKKKKSNKVSKSNKYIHPPYFSNAHSTRILVIRTQRVNKLGTVKEKMFCRLYIISTATQWIERILEATFEFVLS